MHEHDENCNHVHEDGCACGHDHSEDDFGPDLITIEDDEGNSYELELLDTIEMDGKTYMAFCDAGLDENAEAVEITIFRVEETDDGEELAPVEDEDELERAYQIFLEQNEDE